MQEKTISVSQDISSLVGLRTEEREVRVRVPDDVTTELFVHSRAGIDASTMSLFLRSLAAAYDRLQGLDLLLRADFGSDFQIHPTRARELDNRVAAIRQLAKLLRSAFNMPLMVTGVSLHSPGAWEFLASLNPLETLRKFIQDRHERKKDANYRNAAEAARLTIDNEIAKASLEKTRMDLQNESIRQALDLATQAASLAERFQITPKERNQLMGYFIKTPFKNLALWQDGGVIGAAEFYNSADSSYEIQRDRRFSKAVHFLPQLAAATEFERAKAIEELLIELDLDSLTNTDRQLAQRLLSEALNRDNEGLLSRVLYFFPPLEQRLRETLPRVAQILKVDIDRSGIQSAASTRDLFSLGDLLKIAGDLLKVEPPGGWGELIELRNRLNHGLFLEQSDGLEVVRTFLKFLPFVRSLERNISAVTGEEYRDLFSRH